jgi:peptide/nickel transport system substrate-binding protein
MDVPMSMPDEALQLASIMGEMYGAIGLEVEVRHYRDRPAYAEMVREKRIGDMCCFDSSPRSTFRVLREKLHSGFKGPWWEGYSNLEVDRLAWEAQRTFDDEARRRVYQRVFRVVRDDAPWVFLYRPNYHWAVGQMARGWKPEPDGLVRLG